MSHTMRISTYVFDATISVAEIPYLRGNMIRLSDGNPLFHNHRDGKFMYTYPLIQNKRIDNHAAVVGIDQGARVLADMFQPEKKYTFQIGRRQVETGIKDIITRNVELSCSPEGEERTYMISNWLPLNSDNYRTYLSTDTLVERINMLERILSGNILSFAKGMGVFFEKPISCRLLNLSAMKMIRSKGIDLMSFNAEFRSNVCLPEYIGLGKSVSKGCGVIMLKHE